VLFGRGRKKGEFLRGRERGKHFALYNSYYGAWSVKLF
jgi:hypothetical protein